MGQRPIARPVPIRAAARNADFCCRLCALARATRGAPADGTDVGHQPLLRGLIVVTSMHFFLGTVFGIVITVLAAFTVDSLRAGDGVDARIVNWDVAGERVASSLDVIREGVHDLTR
jgi:hypothetical protein